MTFLLVKKIRSRVSSHSMKIQGRTNCDKNTSTTGPTAAQETAGDTNNLRGARTVRNTSIR